MKILMCRPDYFAIEYEINPWMHVGNQVNREKAMGQWEKVYQTYRHMGVRVELIEQVKGLPDMIFTANGGIVWNKTFIVSNHRFKERKGEEKYFREWFDKRGYKTHALKHYQGGEGDALFYQGKLYLGWGFRSDKKSHEEIKKILGVETVSLHLINPSFYDFDIAFCPVGDKFVLYYPKAFDKPSLKKIESIHYAIAMTDQQAKSFVGNSVLVSDTMMIGYSDDSLQKTFKSFGLETKVFDMSEFKKSGGGIKCLTLYLER